MDRRTKSQWLDAGMDGSSGEKRVISQQRKPMRSILAMSWSLLLGLANRHGGFIRPRLGRLEQYAPRPPRNYFPVERYTESASLPVISMVTPSYRQGPFIERTVRSVLQQNYPNIQYVVQDGGSDDETQEVLRQFRSRLHHCESAQDRGQAHAINLGFGHTSGEIMAWLNSDDLLLPGALRSVGEFFNSNPNVDVVYGHRILIDENDFEIGRWILPDHDDEVLSWADFVPQETLYWRREIWNAVGGYVNENFQFAMDWDLLLRFRRAGARMIRIPRYLGAFRVHRNQKTSHSIDSTGFDEMNMLRFQVHGRAVSRREISRAVAPYLGRHLVHHVKRRVKDTFCRMDAPPLY